MGTASATLAFRVIMIIVFSVWCNKLSSQLENYDKCLNGSSDPLRVQYCRNSSLSLDTRGQVKGLLDAIIVALVIALLWLIVSLCGVYFGAVGAKAELGASAYPIPADLELGGGGGGGGGFARGQIVSVQGQVVYATAVPAPVVQIQVMTQPMAAAAEVDEKAQYRA
jgi:hypothetical protein